MPQQSPRQTTEPNMQNESSGVNNDLWRVGEMHDDGRLQIGVIKRVLEPSGKCSGRTRAIMYERLEPRGFTWKEVSKETKQFYFEEFKGDPPATALFTNAHTRDHDNVTFVDKKSEK
ncbi:hypothetical protein POM88_023342 [Heracleum sosnowskyi]|uniref:Uncharacterized protein n=1 Tax=Heracleum sosnowskyi TaxID=360622 RepID=A0AAD8MUU2_9APIA|nr:hypothetical protein POM88_023342 [Heracleum sosnowskyi]